MSELLRTRSSSIKLPSIPAVVFFLYAILVPVAFPGWLLNTDGDLARHLRQGREILATGAVIRTDRFSWTMEGEPFASFEYGSQVLYALAERVAGLAGVVVLASLLIAAAHGLVARVLVRRGVEPLLAYLAALFSGMVAQIHWIARPHLVTILLSALLLGWLEERPRPPRWWFLALFLVWANLHAGFIFGLALIGIYAAGHLLDALRHPTEAASHRRHAVWLLATLSACLGVTLINAYGPALHLHALANLGDPYITGNTIEFLSPNFHAINVKFFLAAVLGGLLLFGLRGRPAQGPALLVATATIGFSLLAQRNIPLFAVTGLPLAVIHFDPLWRRWADRRPRLVRFGRVASTGSTLPWVAATLVLLLIPGLGKGVVAGVPVIPNGFDRRVFPVELVAEAREAGLQGRIFNDFRYGGYLQYAWPEQKVFIDGATDHYGGKHMRAHATVAGLGPGWRDSLASWAINRVLFPVEASLVHELVQDGTWRVWKCDRTAALLLPQVGPPEPDQSLARCLRARRALQERRR